MVDINDIKVGDIVKMSNGAVHTVGEIYKYQRYDLESTNGVSFMSQDVEKILNKYHIDYKVDGVSINDYQFKGTVIRVRRGFLTEQIIYDVKTDDTHRIIYVYEEEIANMDEKKVNFEVGDYVKIDSEKIDSMSSLVGCCGHLGIIVGPGYNKNYWKIYFFELKHMGIVEEKYMVKSEYDYEFEIKPKKKESHGLSSNSGRYPMEEFSAQFLASRGNGKPLTSLKEMYKRYIELGYDGRAVKSALNSIYGFSMDKIYIKNDDVAVKSAFNSMNTSKLPKIKKVIFNGPATIVLWGDGDKTVVHCGEGDTMDKEKGLAMAICKKALGKSKTHYDYYNVFKKWIKESK